MQAHHRRNAGQDENRVACDAEDNGNDRDANPFRYRGAGNDFFGTVVGPVGAGRGVAQEAPRGKSDGGIDEEGDGQVGVFPASRDARGADEEDSAEETHDQRAPRPHLFTPCFWSWA